MTDTNSSTQPQTNGGWKQYLGVGVMMILVAAIGGGLNGAFVGDALFGAFAGAFAGFMLGIAIFDV